MLASDHKNSAHHRRFDFPDAQIVQRSRDLDLGSEQGLLRIRRLVKRGFDRGWLRYKTNKECEAINRRLNEEEEWDRPDLKRPSIIQPVSLRRTSASQKEVA